LAFNPLNTELNPICHLLALLGGHHILHVGRIRVNVIAFLPSFMKLGQMVQKMRWKGTSTVGILNLFISPVLYQSVRNVGQ